MPMNRWRESRRFITAGLTAAMVASPLLGLACGGGGDHSHVTPPMLFTCSGAAVVGADQISLSCPSGTASPLLVTVVIGGPTSPDIYGIKFDLVYMPTIMTFQAAAIEGTLLKQGGATATVIATSPPGDPGRVVVSVTRIGPGGGAQSNAATTPVVVLAFAATDFRGSTTLGFENTQVVDSTLAPIVAIQFASSPLTVSFQ